MLQLKNLEVCIEQKPILQGVNLSIEKGTCHVIMGPNGAGKSTLAKVLAGHPAYEITGGTALFQGENLLEMEPEERAQKGLFMSFQYPLEIAGVTNQQFLYEMVSSLRKAQKQEPLQEEAFAEILKAKMKEMEISPSFCTRGLNEGFSGGEKKKGEILQMALANPYLSVLDETDSGLDIDSMRVVASGIERMRKEENALLLITHYQRLLNYVRPDFVHVMMEGKIVRSGTFALASELEEKGYDWLKKW